jgi:hypothetical protein
MANLTDLGSGTFNMRGTGDGSITGNLTSTAAGSMNYAGYSTAVTMNTAATGNTGVGGSRSGITSVTGSGNVDTVVGAGSTYNSFNATTKGTFNAGGIAVSSFENINDSGAATVNMAAPRQVV